MANNTSYASSKGKNQPLTILIVGAGIGGLTAAIALRQQGHHIKIFEQSRFAEELGAAIHLAPNSNSILRRLGIFAERFGSVVANILTEYNGNGEILRQVELHETNKLWQHPWHLAHRAHLHETLKQAAISQEGKGVPVELNTRSRITKIDEQNGILTLETGTTIQGDLIIGADGVHSLARTRISPTTTPFSSGKSAFRFLIPRTTILSDPRTSPFITESGELKIWYEDDRRIVMYPTSHNDLLNFVCIHPSADSSSSSATSDWNQQASLRTLQETYQTFDPAVQELIAKADPNTLKAWTLLDMNELPTFAKGRLALIGDAAHPFLPHQGQGAGMAIEDGAALSVVLPLGTTRDEVPERLRLYDEIRHERATRVQEVSRIIGGDDFLKKKELDMMSFTAYNFGHDEFDHSARIFLRYQTERDGVEG